MDGSLRVMDIAVNILAVMATSEKLDSLRAALDGVAEAKLDTLEGGLQRVVSRLSKGDTPDILFVDIALDSPGDIELLSRLIRENGDRMAVIATAENAELTGIRKLMRIGVVDFVPQPLARADIAGALESANLKLSQGRKADGLSGRVISFIRSCGGVGATTMAVQSAIELAGRGRKRKSVALLDLDLQFGNAGLALDIQSKGGLPLILESPARLDPAFLRASMSVHESGINVLLAPENIIPLNALAPDTASELLKLSKMEFDFVVCDMPHAWTNWTANILRDSDHIVLVTELSVTALQRTRRQLDVMADQGLEDIPLSILANRMSGGWGERGRIKQAEIALGRSIDHVVHEDTKTAEEARDRGVPLGEIRARSKIVKDLRAFLDEIKSSFQPDVENTHKNNA